MHGDIFNELKVACNDVQCESNFTKRDNRGIPRETYLPTEVSTFESETVLPGKFHRADETVHTVQLSVKVISLLHASFSKGSLCNRACIALILTLIIFQNFSYQTFHIPIPCIFQFSNLTMYIHTFHTFHILAMYIPFIHSLKIFFTHI